jgi:chromosome segregation ATPase
MTQTVEQLTAQLEQVREAIATVLSGKSYRIKDGETERELTRQSLSDLERRETMLERQINRMGGHGVRYGVYVG